MYAFPFHYDVDYTPNPVFNQRRLWVELDTCSLIDNYNELNGLTLRRLAEGGSELSALLRSPVKVKYFKAQIRFHAEH